MIPESFNLRTQVAESVSKRSTDDSWNAWKITSPIQSIGKHQNRKYSPSFPISAIIFFSFKENIFYIHFSCNKLQRRLTVNTFPSKKIHGSFWKKFIEVTCFKGSGMLTQQILTNVLYSKILILRSLIKINQLKTRASHWCCKFFHSCNLNHSFLLSSHCSVAVTLLKIKVIRLITLLSQKSQSRQLPFLILMLKGKRSHRQKWVLNKLRHTGDSELTTNCSRIKLWTPTKFILLKEGWSVGEPKTFSKDFRI